MHCHELHLQTQSSCFPSIKLLLPSMVCPPLSVVNIIIVSSRRFLSFSNISYSLISCSQHPTKCTLVIIRNIGAFINVFLRSFHWIMDRLICSINKEWSFITIVVHSICSTASVNNMVLYVPFLSVTGLVLFLKSTALNFLLSASPKL